MAVVDRRAFLVATIVASGCGPGGKPIDGPQREATTGAAPSIGKSQSAISRQTPPRVAVLVFGSRRSSLVTSGPKSADLLIRDRLEELGYVEGKTIVLEESYADGDPRRLTQLAIDIVASKPDAIVTIAAAATAAARQATNTIPIIMAHVGEPVGAGLVASLARPGGNVTGTTSMIPDLGAKQVDCFDSWFHELAGWVFSPTRQTRVPSHCLLNSKNQGGSSKSVSWSPRSSAPRISTRHLAFFAPRARTHSSSWWSR